MIEISAKSLSQRAMRDLAIWQSEIDQFDIYSERVATGKTNWESKRSNTSMKEVQQVLEAMCSGIDRCMYCEDSRATDIEHIHPKDLYPDRVFDWDNYLLACSTCNRGKSNQFAIFRNLDGFEIDITRKKPDDPVIEPPIGTSVLINPRFENPMDFLFLPLLDPFEYTYHPNAPGPNGKRRAEYTIFVLQLNEKKFPQIRKQAYHNFRARLKEYIVDRNQNAPIHKLELLIESLRSLPQPSVWYEMKRQAGFIQELKDLFSQAPEAMEW